MPLGGRGSCRAENVGKSGDGQVGRLDKKLGLHQRFALPLGSISERTHQGVRKVFGGTVEEVTMIAQGGLAVLLALCSLGRCYP